MENVDTFWQYHAYLAKIWQAINRRSGDKNILRNPFNWNFTPAPLYAFLDYSLGTDPDYQVIFNDPLRQDFFREVEQFHRSLNFSWEQSGYAKEGNFTEQIKVFHEFFENAAKQVWTQLSDTYSLAPLETFARLLPLYSLLSNQLYIISDFCLKSNIPASNYCEYYTVFNEILRKGHDLFQMAAGEPDLVETLLQLNTQLTIYVIMFGFPYFQWQESRGWCPEALAATFSEEVPLVYYECASLEELIDARVKSKIVEWYNKNQNKTIALPNVLPQLTLSEEVVLQNLRLFNQFYESTTIGAIGDKFQQKFGVSLVQASLALHRALATAEFKELAGEVKTSMYVPPPQTLPLVASQVNSPLAEISRKMDSLWLGVTSANVLDPPQLSEIELVLQLIKYPFTPTTPGGTAS